MKFLGLFLVLASVSALAFEVKISGLKHEAQMERSFVLKTNLPHIVILDCQSFIQGLYIGPRSEGQFSMLDPYACEELHSRIKESLSHHQNHCLDMEADIILSDFSCT